MKAAAAFRDGSRWTIPSGWHTDTLGPIRCRRCRAAVLPLCADATHRKAPFDPDGRPHIHP